MKIICLECKRELGEKFPFDDPEATHTICPECIEKKCKETGKKQLRKRFITVFRRRRSLKFDPEVDSLGVE